MIVIGQRLNSYGVFTQGITWEVKATRGKKKVKSSRGNEGGDIHGWSWGLVSTHLDVSPS